MAMARFIAESKNSQFQFDWFIRTFTINTVQSSHFNLDDGMSTLPTLPLGLHGPQDVSALGLGCMGMSDLYGASDRTESLATLRAALNARINLLDTGDFYGMGHNEMLIAEALQGRRERALVSVKFGALRGPDASWLGVDGRPAAVKNFAAYSLKRLGADHIDIYRMARLDPAVPVEDTVGAIADLVKAGWVRHIGLSEVGPQTIARAHRVHPISDLQIEYSLLSRGPEDAIFPLLKELGIGVTAYGVLSRGLLSGSRPTGVQDFRSHLPRFQGENLARNAAIAGELQAVAASLGATATQVAIAWVMARGQALGVRIVPLVGSRRRTQLADALGAARLALSPEAMARIEAAVPRDAASGTRYAAEHMAHLDSEG